MWVLKDRHAATLSVPNISSAHREHPYAGRVRQAGVANRVALAAVVDHSIE
jgi:hypothetical protein